MKRLFVCLTLIKLLVASNAIAGAALPPSQDLYISPVIQRTPVWCWVAVGEMVFEHYDVPNLNPAGDYQCGIIGALAGPYSPCFNNCRICTVPAGSLQAIESMITTYPRIARQATGQDVPRLRARSAYSALSDSQIIAELDNDRPIIAGINPSGFRFPGISQHVALIVGYSRSDSGRLVLTVNDPFPFDLGRFSGQPNPYQRAGGESNGDGSYEIASQNFRQGLAWNTTIYGIGE